MSKGESILKLHTALDQEQERKEPGRREPQQSVDLRFCW
jgi:hypothetical protein